MAKPKQISRLFIRYSGGTTTLKVYKNILKNGKSKYYIEIPKISVNESVHYGVRMASVTLENKTYIEDRALVDDRLEFFINMQSLWSAYSINDILRKIQEEIQGEVEEYEAKKSSNPIVYLLTEQDIDELGVGDVIKFKTPIGTISKITIKQVEKAGQEFVAETEFQATQNSPIQIENRDYIDRRFLLRLKEEQRVVDFKKAPSQKPVSTSTPSASSTLEEYVKNYGITIKDVLKRLGWSEGLKKSMENDFVGSGFFYLNRIVGNSVVNTVRNIDKNILGFNTGKNTYLQAKMIAEEIEKMYLESLNVKSIPTPTPSVASAPSFSEEPIYGIVIRGAFSGSLVKIIKPSNNGYEEKDYDYKCILDGKTSYLPRNNFMVVGDVVKVTFTNTGTILEFKILVLQNNTSIKVIQSAGNAENWNIEYFNWDEDKIEILEYYNLHEKFDSIGMSQATQPAPSPAQPKVPKRTLSDDEKAIEKIKQDISNLIFLKSTFSPIEFEDTIKIGQKIDEKQKEVNKLNLAVVDKKLKGNKIFDDLFEQSFTPIQNSYNVYVESEAENSDFFAPNGEKSMLKNSINSIIRTPMFKEWFGDWQLNYSYRDIEDSGIDCSKIIGSNYEPLIVWHGTGAEFSYFRFDNFPAAYFAVNKSYSEWFAKMQSGGKEGYTMPFFLNLKNPLDLTRFNTKEIEAKDFFDYMYLMTGMKPEELEVNPIFLDPQLPKVQTWVFLRNNPKMLKKLSESHVYDGIHFYETNPSVPEGQDAHVTEAYITFKPESCKIADPDRGDLILASMKSFLLEKGGKI